MLSAKNGYMTAISFDIYCFLSVPKLVYAPSSVAICVLLAPSLFHSSTLTRFGDESITVAAHVELNTSGLSSHSTYPAETRQHARRGSTVFANAAYEYPAAHKLRHTAAW